MLSQDVSGGTTHDNSYALDAIGNITYATTGATTTTRVTNEQNEITDAGTTNNPEYDDTGNMVEDEAECCYVYDAWNRLVTMKSHAGTTVESYTYDGSNRRVEVNGHAVYFTTDWQAIEEYSNGSPSSTLVSKNIWSAFYVDDLIERYVADNATGQQWVSVTHNNNFTITASLETDGDVIERYTNTAYGERTVYDGSYNISASTVNMTFGHQGGELTGEGGAVYFRARYLKSSLCVWMSNDILGFVDGGNRMQYEKGNPFSNVDPMGTEVRTSNSVWNEAKKEVQDKYGYAIGTDWNKKIGWFDTYGDLVTGIYNSKVLWYKDRGDTVSGYNYNTWENWDIVKFIYTGDGHASDEAYNAAKNGAGEYYTDNAGRMHERLQYLGRLGLLTSEVLKELEGDYLHQIIMRGGRIDPISKEDGKIAMERALMSNVAYGIPRTVGDWKPIERGDNPSGMAYTLFHNVKTGKYVLAFRGTEATTWQDWVTDAGQGLGKQVKQYQEAVELGRQLKLKYGDNLEVTGHSLGGGLASTVALAKNIKAIVFNPAGLHECTVNSNGGSFQNAKSLIHVYRVTGDPLTTIQDTVKGFPMPDTVGTITMIAPKNDMEIDYTFFLKYCYSIELAINLFGRHGMKTVIESLLAETGVSVQEGGYLIWDPHEL